VVTTYTYDEANRLTLLTNQNGATTLSSYAYTLFASGKRQVVTDASGATIAYGYASGHTLSCFRPVATRSNNSQTCSKPTAIPSAAGSTPGRRVAWTD